MAVCSAFKCFGNATVFHKGSLSQKCSAITKSICIGHAVYTENCSFKCPFYGSKALQKHNKYI